MADGGEPLFLVSGPDVGPVAGQPAGRPFFFQGPFFAYSARIREAPAGRTFGRVRCEGGSLFFLLSGVERLRVERLGGRSSVRFFFLLSGGSVARRLAGRPRVRWGGGFPLFFPCPPGRAAGALDRSPFSRFASLAEAAAIKAPQGSGAQRRQGPSFPFVFPLFFRSPGRTGRALSSPSRRVLRRSDVGLSFFSCQDERLTAAETRASTAEARVSVLEAEKERPFFSGLGGTRKSVWQALMEELAAKARFPSLFFPPPFCCFFPCQATRVAVLETELRGEKVWTQGFQARCRTLARSGRSWSA